LDKDLDMDRKKITEFMKDPEGAASGWVQTAILKSGASIPRLATLMNRKQDILYKWANPHDLERNFPLCYLPTLIQETDDISILEEIAGMFGYKLVKVNGNVPETLRSIAKAIEGD
jgi:hypothetical protein